MGIGRSKASVPSTGHGWVRRVIRVRNTGSPSALPVRRIQRLHFNVIVVTRVFDMLVDGTSPSRHLRQSIIISRSDRGSRRLGRVKARSLLRTAVRGRSRRCLIDWVRVRRRRLVEWRVIEVLWLPRLLVSTPAGWTATATAALAALVATA